MNQLKEAELILKVILDKSASREYLIGLAQTYFSVKNIEEIEYYSNCCDAPPLGELSYEEKYDAEPVGMCMKCRDQAMFDIGKLENITKEKDNGNN